MLPVPAPALDLVLPLVAPALSLVDQGPEPEDVKAGWTGFVVFLLLIAAVVVLAFSLVKQLRKANAAREAGVYGDEPEVDPGDATRDDGTRDPGADADADSDGVPHRDSPER